MKIKLIVAASENNVIGIKNDLPWHLPNDMNFFKKKTLNSSVIMGKNNFLSIPEQFRPLINRTNIILTRNREYHAKNALIAHTTEEALSFTKEGIAFFKSKGKLLNASPDGCAFNSAYFLLSTISLNSLSIA